MSYSLARNDMENKDLLENFPRSLRDLKQWVVWKYEPDSKGKPTKVPYQPNNRKADSTQAETWHSFQECFDAVDNFDGIGFVFSDGITGIDLDKCLGTDGSVKEFAQEALLEFDSYTEVSPSGTGLHIIVKTAENLPGRKKDNIECYSSKRFFTVTGNVYRGRDTLNECSIGSWYRDKFPEKEKPGAVEPVISGYLPDDETILRVMFSSKGGGRLKNLYNLGAYAAEGYESQSEADLALVGALMFFCRNNTGVVDRLFRQSKLFRGKWDEKHGADTYGNTTMRSAWKTETMTWKEPQTEVEYMMTGGEHPHPILNLVNICRMILNTESLATRFRLNDFSHMVEVQHPWGWGTLTDYDVLEIQCEIAESEPHFAKVSKEIVVDAIRRVAGQNKVNPPVDFLVGLAWDKKSRLDSWLHVVYGVPNDELHRTIGSNWLKGLVKRVMEPGYQFDEVLVLEGEQGWRKSSSLRVLGSPWHVESTLSTEDKDFYMLLARNIIVEFSEGDIVGRTSARKLKAIITKVEDSYRPPYERGLMTFKRGCVFAMTTNDSDYQKDETGGRRWLPVVLTKVADVEWLKENRDQLLAEAFHRVMNLGETTHEYGDELQALQQTKTEYDEITEQIEEWYSGLTEKQKQEGVLTLDAYNGALNDRTESRWETDGRVKEVDQKTSWRIAKVFKVTLGLVNKPLRRDGKLRKRWFRKDETES